MEESHLLTINEAAQMLGVGVCAIYIAIREDRLPFTVKYGRKLVSRQAIEDYRARTRPTGEKPRGRPKKGKEGE